MRALLVLFALWCGDLVAMNTPTDLPGLIRWYDASQESGADDSTLSTFTDRAGYSNATAAGAPKLRTTPALQLNGKNVVQYGGTSDYHSSAATAGSTQQGWWAVIYLDTATVSKLFATDASTGSYMGAVATTAVLTWKAQREDVYSGAGGRATNGRWLVVVGNRDGATRTLWCNGEDLTRTTSAILAADQFVFQILGASAARWLGFIAEFGLTNQVLSPGDLADLKAYLLAKWMPRQLVVCDGNSLVRGVGYGAASLATSYPGVLRTLLGPSYEVTNFGVGGQRIDQMTADFNNQVGNTWSYRSRNIYVAWEFANSIVTKTSADAQADFTALCNTARAAGYTVVALSITGSAGQTADWQTRRTECNAWLRDPARLVANGGIIDALCDIAARPEFSPAGAVLNPTYYSDYIHLTEAGNIIVAEEAYNTIRRLIGGAHRMFFALP